ncbi:MAG: hypothetical protein OEL83_17745 [Desulforhopalus sp.]|nr:hypothetical protein [Desulforhopalus sp.]
MEQQLSFTRIFLILLLVCLSGAAQAGTPPEKIRIFFSGNVLAELGPCG